MNINQNISVIIPTYNRAHLIAKAISSVLDQTYHDFELIVVDDGSTDNTMEVINGFNDPRIRYIRHDKNKGAAAARNTGIKAAIGSYIAFQDSDDEWLPDKLEKQLQAFNDASPKVGVVYSGVWRIVEGNKIIYTGYPDKKKEDGDLHYSLLKKGTIYLQSAMIKKECFDKAGMFDEEIPAAEDWELWIRISKYYHFKYVKEPLTQIYYTPGSLATEIDKNVIAFQLILMKHQSDLKRDRRLFSDYLLSIGSYLCANRHFREGKNYLMQSLRLNPLNILALRSMVVSFLGEDAYLKVVAIYRKIKGGVP